MNDNNFLRTDAHSVGDSGKRQELALGSNLMHLEIQRQIEAILRYLFNIIISPGGLPVLEKCAKNDVIQSWSYIWKAEDLLFVLDNSIVGWLHNNSCFSKTFNR